MRNVPSWRWAILQASREEMPATRALLLLTLSCHMNDVGNGCWPSQATLAEESKLSLRAVQDHLKAAVDAGWIVRKLVWKDGAVAGTVYQAAIPASVLARWAEDDEAAPADDLDADGQGGVAGRATPPLDSENAGGVTQEVREGVAAPAGGSRSSCGRVSQEVHPNSTGNSTRNSTEKEKGAAAPSRSPAPAGRPESGQSESAPMPPVLPKSGRQRVATPEELDQARGDVCRALGLPLKAWFRPYAYHWDQLWRLCAGDTEELVQVFLLGRQKREAAGHTGVTVEYAIAKYESLRTEIYQPSPTAVGGNDAVLERLRRAGV